MVKLSTLLEKRFKKSHSDKIERMAQKSSEGKMSSFSGLFESRPLGHEELNKLQSLLIRFRHEDSPNPYYEEDLNILSSISSELKIIQHQSVILHGERIKKAGNILKKYKDGAFSAWLIFTYGNRQTPYNFLLYYEFYSDLPDKLREIVEKMPRQAVYALASRKGDQVKKQEIVDNYQGESKNVVLGIIRETFPLEKTDGRRKFNPETALLLLEKAYGILECCSNASKMHPSKIIQLQHLLEKLAAIKTKLNGE